MIEVLAIFLAAIMCKCNNECAFEMFTCQRLMMQSYANRTFGSTAIQNQFINHGDE